MLVNFWFVAGVIFSSTCADNFTTADCKSNPVQRPAPTLSRQRRNRLVHALHGNTTPVSQRTRTSRRYSGLISTQRKRKADENQPPSSTSPKTPSRPNKRVRGKGSDTKPSKRSRYQDSDDSDYTPPISDVRQRRTSTATVSTQTVSTVSEQIPHSALIKLQTERRFTDRDMDSIQRFLTQHNVQIQPYFKPFRKRLRAIFADAYDDKPFVYKQLQLRLPAVFCKDVLLLLRSLEKVCGIMFHAVASCDLCPHERASNCTE